MRTADYIDFEENQEPNLNDYDKEDSLQTNNIHSPENFSENNIPTQCQTKIASKRKKKKAEWKDLEVQSLILLWSRFEVLLNAKHSLYYHKNEKNKALNKIKEGLEPNESSFSIKDISEKIANFKNYYGAQHKIVKASKKSGAGTNEVYESKWKFFNQLNT